MRSSKRLMPLESLAVMCTSLFISKDSLVTFLNGVGGNALLFCYEWQNGKLSQFKRLCHMSLILNLYLIGISGKSERMRYSNNSNYEVIRRQGFIVIQWMPTSTSIMKGWFYQMIKSLRCTLAIGKMDARKTASIFYIGVNSRIVSIYYRSISVWEILCV